MDIKKTDNHEDLEDFYIENNLELNRGELLQMNPVFSIVGTENGKTVAAASVTNRFGVYVLDYIAVDKSFRRTGVATKLFDEIKTRFDKFYLTAKVPEFFYFAGCKETNEKQELLVECKGCSQYKNGCNPIVLKFEGKA